MKVVVGSTEGYEGLLAAGHELLTTTGKSREEQIELWRDVDGAISSVAEGPLIELSDRLRIVISPIIGPERIDIETATRLNVLVCNSPSPENFEGVAEATIGLLIVLNKRLKTKESRLRAGMWGTADRPHMLMSSTLGLIGFGRIAREIARRLSGWGIRIIASDPYIAPAVAAEYGVELVDQATVLREADFVSIHLIANSETFKLIGERELRQMKPTAYLINTSRGQVLDEDAFCKAVREDWIAGGALDVFHQEPLQLESPLRELDSERVILTPHGIAHTVESGAGGRRLANETMLRALAGVVPDYVVNPEVIPAWRERFAVTQV